MEVAVSDFLKDQGMTRDAQVSDVQLLWSLSKGAAFFIFFIVSYLLTVLDVAFVGPFRHRLLSLCLFTTSIASLCTTWIHVATFLERQYITLGGKWDVFATSADWFISVRAAVVETPQQWFYTSQGFHFVLALSLFMFVESKRCGLRRPFSNLVVTACGGVAAGFAIFLVGVINAPKVRRREEYVVKAKGVVLCWLIIGLLVTVVLPHMSEDIFSGGVWLGLAACGIPLLMAQYIRGEAYDLNQRPRSGGELTGRPPTPEGQRITVIRGVRCDWLVGAYAALAGFNFAAWFHNLLGAVTTLPQHRVISSLLDATRANECQQALVVDLFLCSLLFATYMMFAAESPVVPRLLILSLIPVVGLGVAFPLFLAYRETQIIPPVDVKQHLERRSSQSSDGTTPFGSRRGSGQLLPSMPRRTGTPVFENFVSPFAPSGPEKQKTQ